MKKLSALILLAGAASGCAIVGPDYVEPEIVTPANFTVMGQEGFVADAVSQGWWKSFSDPQLEQLISDAVSGNRDLEAAVARINQARALRRESFFNLFPIITSDGAYTKSKSLIVSGFGGGAAGGGAGGVPGITSSRKSITSEIWDGGFDAVWELDFFGRVRRNIEARSADTEASIADLQDAVRVLVAEVARNYVQLRGLQLQISVARENAKTQEQVVHVAEALFNGGQTTEFDVVRAKAQNYNTLATIPVFEASAKAAIYRIAVLCGRQPSELIERLQEIKPIPSYQGPVTLGDPATLIRRRPDLRAAERRLASATAEIGVAEGDLFPKVTFTGSISLRSQEVHGAGISSGDVWSFGPGISWAAFDLGRVYARVLASKASAAQALATYQGTVLTALEDVEGALARFSSTRERRDYLRASVDQSTRAVAIAKTQYENGLVDLLPVLDAQRVLLAAQDQLAVSETDLMTSLVAVFKALGGGWEAVEVRGVDPEVTKPEPELTQVSVPAS